MPSADNDSALSGQPLVVNAMARTRRGTFLRTGPAKRVSIIAMTANDFGETHRAFWIALSDGLTFGALLCLAVMMSAAAVWLWSRVAVRVSRRRYGDPRDPTENRRRTAFLKKLAKAADDKALRFRPGTFGLTASGDFVDHRAARCYRAFRSQWTTTPASANENEYDAFFTTLWMTYWTGRPLLGYVLGRSVAGALVGWWFLPKHSAASDDSSANARPASSSWGSDDDSCRAGGGSSSWFGSGDSIESAASRSSGGGSWDGGGSCTAFSSGGSSSSDD